MGHLLAARQVSEEGLDLFEHGVLLLGSGSNAPLSYRRQQDWSAARQDAT
jgi:hypothetical protein